MTEGNGRLPLNDPHVDETLLTTGQVRTRLKRVVLQLEKMHTEVEYLIGQLRNRPPVRKATVQAASLTPQLRKNIEDYAGLNPHLPYSYIAEHFNVNIGRVSEILAGTRGKQ